MNKLYKMFLLTICLIFGFTLDYTIASITDTTTIATNSDLSDSTVTFTSSIELCSIDSNSKADNTLTVLASDRLTHTIRVQSLQQDSPTDIIPCCVVRDSHDNIIDIHDINPILTGDYTIGMLSLHSSVDNTNTITDINTMNTIPFSDNLALYNYPLDNNMTTLSISQDGFT